METVEKAKPTLAANRLAVKKYRESANGKKKIKHKSKVQTAVRSGKLKRPSACSKCGRSGVRLSFHHTDKAYKDGSQLTGRWLCPRCHRRAPREGHSQGQLKKNN